MHLSLYLFLFSEKNYPEFPDSESYYHDFRDLKAKDIQAFFELE